MKLTSTFKNLCTPAMLYFVISVIAILIALVNRMKIFGIVIKAFFVIIYTFFLDFLCKKGYKNLSWFLVLLPYIIMLSVFLMAVMKVKEGLDTINPGASTLPLATDAVVDALKETPSAGSDMPKKNDKKIIMPETATTTTM